MLIGLIGYGLVRSELAGPVSPSAMLVSLNADDVDGADIDDDALPTTEKASSTVTQHRSLPRLRSSPLGHGFPPLASMSWDRADLAGSGACTNSPAGRELLTRFCIARV
ncbi:hypothetical protein [Mycobacterium talmoniae]|uniref:Uncharacterized protein n=1 Tax=Mycobacterium talmoniae TaxID=1858794 RepID=A0A1S1NIA1_9MYCO|nr:MULTISPECIES: hypothetical protein [Mycobacterium]OHV05649.1 hypothetical protein BKN37_04860 [Mycobacterium talmoniae]TDH52060.1 hypothetical protein E2F47_14815 [Mycobacterium eburneum]